LVRRIVGLRVGRYSDFWHFTPKYFSTSEQAYSLYLLRVDGLAPKRIRGKAFVASYSSATVAEFHGVPCTDVLNCERLKELGGTVSRGKCDFKKILDESVAALMRGDTGFVTSAELTPVAKVAVNPMARPAAPSG
jgi:hypothetical protein